MNLDSASCYQAIVTHDQRFDGAFYVGVKTTHIYCRTVCTAKTPKRQNCQFFASAAAAELAGFRPCLRCRPELAPGQARVDSSGRLAAAIARRIEDGALAQMSVLELADELGLSERHLRRVVESEFGASPIDLAKTQRLLLAKRLLTDTALPVTEIAFASGFRSVRRFNTMFKERYNINPTQLRHGRTKRSRQEPKDEMLRFELGYRSPFDWQSLVTFLSRRTAGGAETFINNRYLRTVSMGDARGWLEAAPHHSRAALTVDVSIGLSHRLLPLLSKLRRLFDLNADPQSISEHLGALAAQRPGLRVPGCFDSFELGVRAILGQQVSVKGASLLMTRFVDRFGEEVETPYSQLTRFTPTASQIAALTPEQIAEAIKIPQARAKAIAALATALHRRTLQLDSALDLPATLFSLTQIPGIGEWTAQYIAMRALNWPDAFPHGDLALRKALKEKRPAGVLTRAESWRPWRAYAAMHLWRSLEV